MALELLINENGRASFAPQELEKLQGIYTVAYPLLHLQAEVLVVGRTEIQQLNNQYRALNEPTDVLSFPTLPTLATIEKQAEQGTVLIGSIVLCPSKAEEYKERVIDLVHHGLLHLLGFDHETDRVKWDREEGHVLTISQKAGLPLRGIPHDAV